VAALLQAQVRSCLFGCLRVEREGRDEEEEELDACVFPLAPFFSSFFAATHSMHSRFLSSPV
jgi:hypothetical protein